MSQIRTESRGTKRKRHTEAQDETAVKLKGRLHHGIKEVIKSAKKAKTFETQKLVKRLKSTRPEDAESKVDFDAQLSALKHIDIERIAFTALRTKLKKDHLLSENADVQSAIEVELPSSPVTSAAAGTPEAKVESRLFSSKILAADVLSVIAALKRVLQPVPKDKHDEDEGVVNQENQERPKKISKHDIPMSQGLASSSELLVDDDDDDDDDAAEDNDEGTDIDDAGWESGSVQDAEGGGWSSGTVDKDGDGDSDSDDSDEDHKPVSLLKAPDRLSKLKPSKVTYDVKSKAVPATTGTSTFLPSLSVGFTRGDSDASDISDHEEIPEKKNRRGQRARRAIWEKKYGKNANHMKKEQEAVAQDPRRAQAHSNAPGDKRSWKGAPPRANATPQRQGPLKMPPPDGGWNKVKTIASVGGRSTERVEDKPLHPSWEAKRKLKEKLNPVIVPSQGKKIVF